MSDFNISEFRAQLRSDAGRRSVSPAPAARDRSRHNRNTDRPADTGPATAAVELRGVQPDPTEKPDPFAWATPEIIQAPPAPAFEPLSDWPPLAAAPPSPLDRARPFGRRLEGGRPVGPGIGDDAPVLELVCRVKDKAAKSESAARRAPISTLDALPEVPPDPRPDLEAFVGDLEDAAPELARVLDIIAEERCASVASSALTEAEFEDIPSPDQIAIREMAEETQRRLDGQTRTRLFVGPAPEQPAVKLLRDLANRLACEQAQLDARRTDAEPPLILTPLRRRKSDRMALPGLMDLATANDRV